MRHAFPLAALPLALLLAASPARAEVQNCMEIGSLPAALDTQGIYCLTHDLSTNLASGTAISVGVNNVTIDCNGFKIGGLPAGATTRAIGIDVQSRQNVTVRNCAVRGFFIGIQLQDGGAHVVEDNRLEANTYVAIGSYDTHGDILRRNHVTDTGGNLPLALWPYGAAFGIAATGASGVVVDDNVVATVSAGPTTTASGIAVFDSDGFVRDNLVSGIVTEPGVMRYGINANVSSLVIRDNSVSDTWAPGHAIFGTVNSYCADNHRRGFSTSSIHLCEDGGGNSP